MVSENVFFISITSAKRISYFVLLFHRVVETSIWNTIWKCEFVIFILHSTKLGDTYLCHVGGTDCVVGDSRPRGDLGDRESFHDGRSSQRTDWTAGEDCSWQLHVQWSQVPTTDVWFKIYFTHLIFWLSLQCSDAFGWVNTLNQPASQWQGFLCSWTTSVELFTDGRPLVCH